MLRLLTFSVPFQMLILVLVAVVSCLVFWWRKRVARLPPGPAGLPIVGYLPWLDPNAPYETLTDLARKYGPVYGVSLGNIYSVVLTDPKTIKRVFAKDATTGRAPLYLTHGIMHGYGIICAQGYLWKDQRKFAFNCLRKFGASKVSPQLEKDKMEKLIMENVSDFIYYTLSLGNGKIVFDPIEPLRHSLGSIMNFVVFGRTWDRNDVTWKWLQHLQEEGTKCIGVAGPINFLPFLRFLPKFKQTINFLMNGKQATHRIYQRIIDEQSKILLKQNISEADCTNFIDAFLIERQKREHIEEYQKFYCEKQFHHLLADVFGAGLDTTLTTLRWYLLYMATNGKVQQLVRDEIKATIQDRLPTANDMQFMPLVEASIAETQRIRSVVPVGIPHGTLEDMEIDGYHIPKGTMLVPLQWAIHMNETAWKNPHEFDPMRFIDENCKFYKPDYFMPFQAGKRMCIGDDWARVIMFLFVTSILQKFSIELEDAENIDLEGECGITLSPKKHQIVFNVL